MPTTALLVENKAMATLGVDGIISDYPDRLVSLFGSYQEGGAALPDRITQYEEDKKDLSKVYIFPNSPEYYERFRRLHREALASLQKLSFEGLSTSDKVDYVLWQRTLRHSLLELDQSERIYDSVKFALPFARKIMELQIRRRRGHTLDAQATALVLDSVRNETLSARQLLEKRSSLSREQVKMIVDVTESVREGLKNVETFYEGYDPAFTWWVKKPCQQVDSALEGYVKLVLGMVKESDAVNPIGEAKLKELLQYEMVPYGPTDLVEIANRQFAWCEAEMKKAAAALGFGDNWKAALEKIKQHHELPGGQPEMINNLAEEAIQFLESRDLVTIPSLAKEAWRMFMLTPEEQRYAPFFLGGESILIAYPTEDMPEDIKVMSMRSNNYGFSHATVFHELIPGHNLQGFMNRSGELDQLPRDQRQLQRECNRHRPELSMVQRRWRPGRQNHEQPEPRQCQCD